MAFKPQPVRAYNAYDADAVSNESGLECKDPSRTRQSDAADADINNIVRNFGLTGKMPENIRLPSYGDFDFVGDYRTALEAVRAADAAFMDLPADLRFKFDNDPQKYLEFVDTAPPEKLVEYGLAKAKPVGNEPPVIPAAGEPPPS